MTVERQVGHLQQHPPGFNKASNKFEYGFLNSKENRLAYLRWLELRLGYKEPSDWYAVTRKDFDNNYGSGLLVNHYKYFRIAVEELYPDYDFLPWKFGHQRDTWNDPEVRSKYVRWLAKPEQLNICSPSDWYVVRQDELMEKSLYGGFWRKFNNSIADCLIDALPELNLRRWKFGNCPYEFWDDPNNREVLINDIKSLLVLKCGDDLVKYVDDYFPRSAKGHLLPFRKLRRILKDEMADGYMRFHAYSIQAICEEFYPDYDWSSIVFIEQPSSFSENIKTKLERPRGFWLSRTNRLQFVNNSLRSSLSINAMEDWYEVSLDMVNSNSGRGLLKYYKSHIDLLIDLVEDNTLDPWLFVNKPDGFWDEDGVESRFLDWFMEANGFASLDCFYEVSRAELERECQAYTLVRKYSNVHELLVSVYPDHEWDITLFQKQHGLLEQAEVRRDLFEKLESTLGISEVDDWYKESTLSVRSNLDGLRLLKYFSGSMISMLQELRPGDWKPWLFGRVSRSFWSSEDSRRKALDWLVVNVLQISISEAHKVTHKDLEENGLITMLTYHDGSLLKAFTDLFPGFRFDPKLFSKTGKNEVRLFDSLTRLFPNINIVWGEFYPELVFSRTGRPMQLDFFFPDFLVAIEYQGDQHYRPAWGGTEELRNIQRRDQEKRLACINAGIDLIEIPDSDWDGTDETLLAYLAESALRDLIG